MRAGDASHPFERVIGLVDRTYRGFGGTRTGTTFLLAPENCSKAITMDAQTGPARATVRQADPSGVVHPGTYQRARVRDGELRYLRTGSGRTIVLLHTLRTQLEIWMPVLRELGSQFDVVAPDLPGHGQSSAPRVTYSATYFIDVTEQFLEVTDARDVIVVMDR